MTRTVRKRGYKRRSIDVRIADLEARVAELKARQEGGKDFSAKAVRSDRERLGISAADYAELVGVSAMTVYSWERGKTRPRPEQLERWLAVKGMKESRAFGKLGKRPRSGRSGFTPRTFAAERDRLELSAADYGELIGVSGLTVYNWEKGKTKPREAQLEKWLVVKGIGKRKAWRELGYE